jgi:hypothetical protein
LTTGIDHSTPQLICNERLQTFRTGEIASLPVVQETNVGNFRRQAAIALAQVHEDFVARILNWDRALPIITQFPKNRLVRRWRLPVLLQRE